MRTSERADRIPSGRQAIYGYENPDLSPSAVEFAVDFYDREGLILPDEVSRTREQAGLPLTVNRV